VRRCLPRTPRERQYPTISSGSTTGNEAIAHSTTTRPPGMSCAG
jgi:hypothetical protein